MISSFFSRIIKRSFFQSRAHNTTSLNEENEKLDEEGEILSEFDDISEDYEMNSEDTDEQDFVDEGEILSEFDVISEDYEINSEDTDEQDFVDTDFQGSSNEIKRKETDELISELMGKLLIGPKQRQISLKGMAVIECSAKPQFEAIAQLHGILTRVHTLIECAEKSPLEFSDAELNKIEACMVLLGAESKTSFEGKIKASETIAAQGFNKPFDSMDLLSNRKEWASVEMHEIMQEIGTHLADIEHANSPQRNLEIRKEILQLVGHFLLKLQLSEAATKAAAPALDNSVVSIEELKDNFWQLKRYFDEGGTLDDLFFVEYDSGYYHRYWHDKVHGVGVNIGPKIEDFILSKYPKSKAAVAIAGRRYLAEAPPLETLSSLIAQPKPEEFATNEVLGLSYDLSVSSEALKKAMIRTQ